MDLDEEQKAEADRIASLKHAIAAKEADLGSLEQTLAEARRALAALTEQLRDALERREKAVREREEKMRQVNDRVEEAAEKAKGRMDLNVGGRVFSFTTETLAKYPESFFGRLVSGRWERGGEGKGKKKRGADEIETVFVERPYGPFKHIAAFLITDALDAELSEPERDALLRECDYYGLDELSSLLKSFKKRKQVEWNFVAPEGEEDCLNRRGNVYSCVSDGRGVSLIGMETWESGVHKWTVRVDKGKDIWIGVCQKDDGSVLHSHWPDFNTGDVATLIFDADARKMEIRWTNADGQEGSDHFPEVLSAMKHAYCFLRAGDQITLLLETD